MRIALFGDIHANLEALEVVLADAREQGCTDFVCLGDVVGYNANPSECLEIVRSMDCPVVKGNHDEDAAGDLSLDAMNPSTTQTVNNAPSWRDSGSKHPDKFVISGYFAC